MIHDIKKKELSINKKIAAGNDIDRIRLSSFNYITWKHLSKNYFYIGENTFK